MQCWNVKLHSAKVRSDESGLHYSSFFPFIRGSAQQVRVDITNWKLEFTSHGLQLLVVGLHTMPRCRSPEFLVIETPALEGAAAEYRGMRVFAATQLRVGAL